MSWQIACDMFRASPGLGPGRAYPGPESPLQSLGHIQNETFFEKIYTAWNSISRASLHLKSRLATSLDMFHADMPLSRECTTPQDPQADALKLERQRDLFTLIEAMTYVLKIPCTKEIPIPRICKWNSGSKDWVNSDNNQNMYSTSSQ